MVKPLIADPPKSGQPLYSGRLTCPQLILPQNYYILNLWETETSQLVPNNGHWSALDVLDPKTKHYILALLLIVLAFLISVKQRRVLKMQTHRVNTLADHAYTGSIPNAYIRIPDLAIAVVINVALTILLLNKLSNWSRLWSRIYYI